MFQFLKNIFARNCNNSAQDSSTMPKSSTSPATSSQAPSMVGSILEETAPAGHFIKPTLPGRPPEEPLAPISLDSAQATQTTFSPPDGHLGPRHPLFGANTRIVYPPISNIAMPKITIFGSSASASSSQQPAHELEVEDIEMEDTLECQEPVHSSDQSSVPNEKAHESPQQQATVEEDKKEEAANSRETTPTSANNRNKLTPKRPQDCRPKVAVPSEYVRPDYASQVVWETFTEEDPMPKGYMGTLNGIRWGRSTVEDYSPCGSGGGHHLICGHEVISKEPCGANCKTPQHTVPAFNCSQCRDIANEILINKVTDEERTKMAFYRNSGHPLAMPLCVEYVSKYMPERPEGIAETVMCILNPDYGRECLAYITISDEDEPKTLAEMFRKSHDRLEQKTREHLAWQGIEPMVAHDKRKDASDGDGNDTDAKHQAEFSGSESSGPSSSPCEATKKRKAKLETHREPITADTRGTKRNTPEVETDDSGYDADTSGFASRTKHDKKHKQKLRTHPEPITSNTHGMKRKGSFDSVSSQETKRLTIASPPKFGEASFMTPPASVLGPLLRKRETALDVESNKRRRRSEDMLPGYGIKDPMSAFAKKRVSLADVVVGEDEEWGGD